MRTMTKLYSSGGKHCTCPEKDTLAVGTLPCLVSSPDSSLASQRTDHGVKRAIVCIATQTRCEDRNIAQAHQAVYSAETRTLAALPLALPQQEGQTCT